LPRKGEEQERIALFVLVDYIEMQRSRRPELEIQLIPECHATAREKELRRVPETAVEGRLDRIDGYHSLGERSL
jgi:hypothetical protein